MDKWLKGKYICPKDTAAAIMSSALIAAEYNRKLKTLLGDIKSYYRSDSECKEYKCADCIHFDECGWGKQHSDGYKWRFEDNVNALIGGNNNESKD